MPTSKYALSALIASTFLAAGCGSPAATGTPSQKPNTVSSTSSSEPANTTEISQATQTLASTPQQNQPKHAEREITQAPSAPSTAKDAIAAINLLELPRLDENNMLQRGPTYLYYACKGTLPEADAFHKELLKSRGWKEIPPVSPPTDQYVDRFFEKNGYYVRANLSLASEPGKLGIMLSNVGNVDVRTLPRLPDATTVEASETPANVTFKTAKSIPDAADALHKRLTENGWQRWEEPYATPMDMPHYRDMHFRKGACRLDVGVLKNPETPAEKTTVFYHAEYVIPFDIPMLDATRTLKLDLISNRATFETNNSRMELVELLQTESENFGWKLKQADKFENGEIQMVPIDVASGTYIVARLFESEGKYSASIESYASDPNSIKPTTDSVVEDRSQSVAGKPPASNAAFDELNAQINSTIQAEVSKALGSLSSPAGKAPMNLAELQAKANEQLAKLSDPDETLDDESEKEMTSENLFDVAEDTSSSSEIQAIKKSMGNLKYGNDSYELPFVASYVMKVNGEPTKCILFSDSPIDIAKLKQMILEEGMPVHGALVSEKSKALLDLRVSTNLVSLNAKIGSNSIGLVSSKIRADVHFFKGRIAGKVSTLEPIALQGPSESTRGPLEFSVSLNQTVIQFDQAKQ